VTCRGSVAVSVAQYQFLSGKPSRRNCAEEARILACETCHAIVGFGEIYIRSPSLHMDHSLVTIEVAVRVWCLIHNVSDCPVLLCFPLARKDSLPETDRGQLTSRAGAKHHHTRRRIAPRAAVG
jgi:hypothetical protein